MARLDEDGWVTICNICDTIMDIEHSKYMQECYCKTCSDVHYVYNGQRDVWREFYKHPVTNQKLGLRFLPEEMQGDLCRECFVRLTPLAFRFADIAMVGLFASRLLKEIKDAEKRIQG